MQYDDDLKVGVAGIPLDQLPDMVTCGDERVDGVRWRLRRVKDYGVDGKLRRLGRLEDGGERN